MVLPPPLPASAPLGDWGALAEAAPPATVALPDDVRQSLAGTGLYNPIDVPPELLPYVRQVSDILQNVQYPDLNPFAVNWNSNLPTVQEMFLKGRQAKYGLPVNDQLANIQRWMLSGYRQPSMEKAL